jgi:hypothetical protein
MAAAILNEEWFQGRTHRFRVQVVNERTGAAVGDLTGYLFTATFKTSHDDADPGLFQLTLGSGIEVVDNVDSIVEVEISDAATSASAFVGKTTKGYLDVQTEAPTGEHWILASGRGTVRPPVTRAT